MPGFEGCLLEGGQMILDAPHEHLRPAERFLRLGQPNVRSRHGLFGGKGTRALNRLLGLGAAALDLEQAGR